MVVASKDILAPTTPKAHSRNGPSPLPRKSLGGGRTDDFISSSDKEDQNSLHRYGLSSRMPDLVLESVLNRSAPSLSGGSNCADDPALESESQSESGASISAGSSSYGDQQKDSLGSGSGFSSLSNPADIIAAGHTFNVVLKKSSQGLGISIMGGVDASNTNITPVAPSNKSENLLNEKLKGFIRIKKIFPMSSAWGSTDIEPGDIILSAEGISVIGLTLAEALQVLRSTPKETTLTLCRLSRSHHRRSKASSSVSSGNSGARKKSSAPSPKPLLTSSGTFEVTLTKVNKSLGFTVKKNDNSVLGHCIKELVKEPALSNGNLMPGDKIISVNGVDISPMSHSEAVAFLRACSDEVTLVLYRDDPIAQTPLSPLSPDDYPIMSRTPQLRVEAREMLEEIAFARNSPSFTMEGSPGSPGSTAGGYSSLGRRRRRKEGGSIASNGSTGPRPTSLDFDGVKKQRYVFTPPASASHPADEEEGDSDSPRVFTFTETSSNGDNADDDEDIIEGGPLDRHRGSIPIVVTPGAPILEPLSPDAPDAVEIVTLESELGGDMPMSQAEPSGVEFPKTPGGDEVDRGGFRPPPPPAFASTPKSDKDAQDRSDFYHDMDSQPMSLPSTAFLDQSEHLNNNDIQNDDDRSSDEQMTMGGLLKWRGARIEDRGSNIGDDSVEVFRVEVSRGWNSRLGFSLMWDPLISRTVVKVVHPDTPAAKLGKLAAGDAILQVNDHDVTTLPTPEVIDILRKSKGKICLIVERRPMPPQTALAIP